MVWTILIILVAVWLIGFLRPFGGSLVHIFLIAALLLLAINVVGERKNR